MLEAARTHLSSATPATTIRIIEFGRIEIPPAVHPPLGRRDPARSPPSIAAMPPGGGRPRRRRRGSCPRRPPGRRRPSRRPRAALLPGEAGQQERAARWSQAPGRAATGLHPGQRLANRGGDGARPRDERCPVIAPDRTALGTVARPGTGTSPEAADKTGRPRPDGPQSFGMMTVRGSAIPRSPNRGRERSDPAAAHIISKPISYE